MKSRGRRTGMRAGAGMLLVATMIASTGCWGRGFAEVKGTVRIDGKPLQGAFVAFSPDGPDPVRGVGATNADGRYRVLRPGSKYGAMIGTNRVSVTGGDGGMSLPAEYATGSKLTYEVKRGQNVFDIDIRTK
ncbi:MAG: hypothetical protein ACR2IT_11600 [Pirellulales bacterium]